MAISQITRRAIMAILETDGYWWGGDLDEVGFLSRLFPLEELDSTDPRYSTALDDIIKHCVANCDWLGAWPLTDERFGLAQNDELLLSFLAETVHPEVRSNPEQRRQLVGALNAELRRDGVELYPTRFISSWPVYGWRRVVRGVPTPMKMQDAIAEVIWENLSARRVAEYCEGLGLGPPRGPSDNPMSSKRDYVLGHTTGMTLEDLVKVASTILADFDDPNLRSLVEAVELGTGGVRGALKNLIFAAEQLR
jgi:hypothetical protein